MYEEVEQEWLRYVQLASSQIAMKQVWKVFPNNILTPANTGSEDVFISGYYNVKLLVLHCRSEDRPDWFELGDRQRE